MKLSKAVYKVISNKQYHITEKSGTSSKFIDRLISIIRIQDISLYQVI